MSGLEKILVWLRKMPRDGFNLCLWLNADIGADVLDLAETMVASDGLKYEPVSYERLHCAIAIYLMSLYLKI